MGKKGRLVSIFSRLVDSPSSPAAAGSASPPWPWPSCRNNLQTTSFRADEEGPCCATARGQGAATAKLHRTAPGEMYKTVNSVYFDSADDDDEQDGEVLGLDDDSFSTTTASAEWSEEVIRSLGRTPTDRFFFDPGPASNSILAVAASSTVRKTPPAETKTVTPDPDDGPGKKEACTSLAEGSVAVAVAVDSADPYGDFRASMEEMVAAHGLRDWAALEELLSWYLRINGKHNHPLIVGAFVDLLLGLASSSPSAAETTTATATTTTSSSSSCSASTTTSIGDATTTTNATAKPERCGGGTTNGDTSCSSSSSWCAAADVQDVVKEKASIPSDDEI
ncbi:transcription repressor OFP13-like [Phragmites australis]|uniref:transcription repressor OFP13-like n=1 Tax=Phragmites australis TaxID=29695 RepID=UPI002D775029|nr:transcription repressor OFP13-like [Phragmites australis]